ncbi:hypothetical protein SAMN05444395_101540 [Flavobacterium fryxellicola]|uniref:WYL domain-containing protein n=1 Tax=Flavobacterium fryxellicola TaxID=249352 RepID=A0A168AH34_9FLAO|nr:hypothetical protein [Flavobacterium fryxellicola]OAB31465.1 hypothetical protein FBFR_01150 [Flavobacterium fryxellicola]SHN53517.1 hypothetical protein SAMN05444395_101540 [Flavobacterium fryxellicola]
MNNYSAIEINYLRPSRTIETILLENSTQKRIVYVYNYEGWHFRVFNNILDILNFFDNKFECEISFENERELGEYFENCNLNYYKF